MLTVAAYARDRLTLLDDLLRFTKDAGLTQVQLSWEQVARAEAVGKTSPSSPRSAAETGFEGIVERLRSEEVEPIGLDAAVLDCLDDETFEKQMHDIRVQMQAARWINAGHISITAGVRDSTNFAYVARACRSLASRSGRGAFGVSIRNAEHSSVEQLDDLHRLFYEVGDNALTLDLDMAEFQAAVVNPYDAVISFPGRISRVRVCDVHLEVTLAALQRNRFAGPVLAAITDGPKWARRVTTIVV